MIGPGPAGRAVPVEPVEAIVALAAEVQRDLVRLRRLLEWLDEAGERTRRATSLTDDWVIGEHGLFGPDGVLGFVTARGGAGSDVRSDAA